MNHPDALPNYSIIVPVYNGEDTLERCLTALTHQDYPVDRYEIIVVDDGSTDNSAAIARQFAVRMVQLSSNQGRIVARNTGARAAAYERLVFVDSRVLFPRNGLRCLTQVEHLPQLFHVNARGEGLGWFNRLFTLIRQRYYHPRPPLTLEEAAQRESYLITPKNFGRATKGTGAFACMRDLWLACQPENQSKNAHDDVPILRAVVERAPILQRYDIVVTYLQREGFGQVMRHMFMRGPRFASYYLSGSGRAFGRSYASLLTALTVSLAGLFVAMIILTPTWGLLIAAAFVLLIWFAAGLYLARRPVDVLLVMLLLPSVISAFGMGLAWGIFRTLFVCASGRQREKVY